MKALTKALSLFLTVIILLSAEPLGGFVGLDFSGLFASEADAAVNYGDIEFSAEDYIAGIILNTNKQSCAVSGDGKSVASMTLDYYTQPQNVSLSKCYTDVLESDTDFMTSVAAWEVLTFEPSDIYSETMTKQGYYQTIIFDILEIAVDYNIVPSIVKNMNNHVISTLKSINELKIKVDDTVVNGDTAWDLINAEQQNKIIQKTAGRMTELEMRNQDFSNFAMIVKTCTTVTDFVEKAAQLTALTTLTEDVKAVINELYANCSYVNNMELKSAILELKNAMNSKMDSIGTIGLDLLCSTGKLSMDIFLDQMWGEAVTACLGSLGAGLLIGQVIGRGLSNILFSTDKMLEQFYTMQALADVELLMCKTVKSLGQKYISSQNTTNASNFLKSIDLLYNTYKLDFEYTEDFVEIIYTKGLINKVKLFVSGTPYSLEQINSIVQLCRNSLSLSLGMLTDIDDYCWYMEADHPEVFDVYYGGMSYEDINNNYVENVRMLTVACPTDVDVYDNDELVISVKNNLVELCLPGYVCIVEDDVKHIMLTSDKQLSIRITGTADGKMTYTVCEGNKAGFDRKMVFKDVALTQGCTYDTVVPETIYDKKEKYNLISDSGEEIECNSDSLIPVQDNIVDVIVAEELFDGFPVEVIDLVANTMFNMESVVDLSAYDISTDDAVALFSAISKYYPAEYSLIANGDFTYKIIVSPELDRIMKIRFYYGDDANLSTYQKRVKDLKAEIDALVAEVEGMNDFEKALYIHDYIVLNCEYDLELLDILETTGTLTGELYDERYTEYSVLVNGTGICGSYALAYRAILNAAGMECLYLSSRQMNHAWNLVKIDGEWYHVDCCWDDPIPDTYGRARRTYFLRTDEEIMNLNHYSWSPGQYKASSEKYSAMPRNYDYTQKYENGYWYYTDSGDIVKSDAYGTNTQVIAENIYTNTIAVNNGDVYYANGRYIYKYDDDTDTSVLAAYLISSECGDKLDSASVKNMYIDEDAENITIYKYIYEDEEYKTIKTIIPIEPEKYESITGIKFSDTALSLDVFTSKTIIAEIDPVGVLEEFEIVFASSDEAIASVSATGEITAKNVGTATITALFGMFSATCEVTVTGDGLSGMCGDNVVWAFDLESKCLTLSGNGATYNYGTAETVVPWENFVSVVNSCVVEQGINRIGDNLFDSCDNLNRIQIGSTVNAIGKNTFKNCFSLAEIDVSAENTAFVVEENVLFDYDKTEIILYPCGKSETEYSIPEGVRSITGFLANKYLETVNIPATLEDLSKGNSKYDDYRLFRDFDVLKTINVSDDNEFFCDIDGVLFNKNMTELFAYPANKEDIIYSIPDTVITAYLNIFTNVKNLKTLIISENVDELWPFLSVFFGSSYWTENYTLEYIFVKGDVSTPLAGVDYFVGLKKIYTLNPDNYLYVRRDESEFIIYSPRSGHDYDECIYDEPHKHGYFLMDYKDASENEDGYEYWECYCGEDSYTKVIHHFGDEVVTVPTCTIEGTTSVTCTVCGEVEVRATTEATGKHNFELTSTTPGDCETAPVYHYTCSVCSETQDKVGRIDDGHDYAETVTPPTCINKGSTIATCSKCDETVIYDFVSPKGHTLKIKNTGSYCSAHDTLEYSCTICDYIEVIAANTDALVTEKVTVEPTCAESGKEIEKCTLCGAVVSEKILRALSHDYSDEFTVDKEATCTVDGEKSKHCSRCDARREITAISAPGHSEDEWNETVKATCTADGEKIKACTVCGEVVATEIISAAGHAAGGWIIDNAPTCVESGTEIRQCTACEEIVDIREMAAAGHNDGDADNFCDECSEKLSEKTNCTCGCHKSGFIGFIWKIILFFWKLFKMNPVCSCGIAHY